MAKYIEFTAVNNSKVFFNVDHIVEIVERNTTQTAIFTVGENATALVIEDYETVKRKLIEANK